MSRTYQVVGINLKNTPLGESDRVITILTRDRGLVRAIAPGARTSRSSLSGRCNTFVINQLLITKGKTLDRIAQAETIVSYAALSHQFGTLIASQYFAELALIQAQENQADPRLFDGLLTQLDQLITYSSTAVLPKQNSSPALHQPDHKFSSHSPVTSTVTPTISPEISTECISQPIPSQTSGTPLNTAIASQLPNLAAISPQTTAITTLALICEGVFRLLEIAGIVPQVRLCCLSQTPIFPDLTQSQWRSGFNLQLGGVLDLAIVQQLQDERAPQIRDLWADDRDAAIALQVPRPDHYLNAIELTLLQHLAYERSLYQNWNALTQPHLQTAWFNVERLLRQYVQYHFGRGIQSATLLDSYFLSLNPPSHPR